MFPLLVDLLHVFNSFISCIIGRGDVLCRLVIQVTNPRILLAYTILYIPSCEVYLIVHVFDACITTTKMMLESLCTSCPFVYTTLHIQSKSV